MLLNKAFSPSLKTNHLFKLDSLPLFQVALELWANNQVFGMFQVK
jgi:hypothetical protein